MDLYVYYRVNAQHAAALQPKVLAMQQQLAPRLPQAPALKRRPDEKNGEQTWMEVYSGAPEGFAAALDQAVAEANLAELVSGGRHTEVFIDLPPCA